MWCGNLTTGNRTIPSESVFLMKLLAYINSSSKGRLSPATERSPNQKRKTIKRTSLKTAAKETSENTQGFLISRYECGM